MKFRIKEERLISGTIYYHLQKRVLFFFWIYISEDCFSKEEAESDLEMYKKTYTKHHYIKDTK